MQKNLISTLVLLIALTFLATNAFSQAYCATEPCEPCQWFSAEDVNALLPTDSAPWKVQEGGEAGYCEFIANTNPPRTFVVAQSFSKSTKEAIESVQSLRKKLKSNFIIQTKPALGANSFYYVSKKPKKEKDPAEGWVIHDNTVFIFATVSFDVQGKTLIEAQRPAFIAKLKNIALRANTAGASSKVTCPYFDAAILKKLIPGTFIKIESTRNFCLASSALNSSETEAGADMLIFHLRTFDDAKKEISERSKENECTSEMVPQLGDSAILDSDCKDGSGPHLHFSVGQFAVMMTTTSQNKDALIEMGHFAAKRIKAKKLNTLTR